MEPQIQEKDLRRLYYIKLYYIVLSCIILYYIVLYCIDLYWIVLYVCMHVCMYICDTCIRVLTLCVH